MATIKIEESAIRTAIDVLQSILDGNTEPADSGTDDPLTSPLTAEGAWVPPYLAQCIRKAKKLFPDGYGPEEYSFEHGKKVRKPITYPRAYVIQSVRDRADLTEPQKALIQECNRYAIATTVAWSGSKLAGVALEQVLTGGYLYAVATVYDTNLDVLRDHTLRLFAEFGVTLDE